MQQSTTDDTSPLLHIDGVTKRYRQLVAVDDFSVDVDSGEFVGLIGPNGAGKTTLMSCVTGSLAVDSGRISVAGVDVGEAPVDVRRHVGFVSQELELYEYLTGREFLEFVADVRGMDQEAGQQRIDELLEATELTEAQDRLLKEYSGGMARKVTLASALLGPPDLLLLDESFVGLDPESSYRIRRELRDFCDDGGAIVLSSHSLEMIQQICSRVLIMSDGALQRDLSSDEIRARIEEGEVADLTEIYLEVTGKARAALTA